MFNVATRKKEKKMYIIFLFLNIQVVKNKFKKLFAKYQYITSLNYSIENDINTQLF